MDSCSYIVILQDLAAIGTFALQEAPDPMNQGTWLWWYNMQCIQCSPSYYFLIFNLELQYMPMYAMDGLLLTFM